MAERGLTPEESTKSARGRRRAVIPAPEGTESSPEREPERHRDDENVQRLKEDKPPHY